MLIVVQSSMEYRRISSHLFHLLPHFLPLKPFLSFRRCLRRQHREKTTNMHKLLLESRLIVSVVDKLFGCVKRILDGKSMQYALSSFLSSSPHSPAPPAVFCVFCSHLLNTSVVYTRPSSIHHLPSSLTTLVNSHVHISSSGLPPRLL